MRIKKSGKGKDLLTATALGGVRARYFASVHSCAVKWSRKTKGKTWTDYSRLDIKHLLRWELSSLPVHGVDSRC